MKSAGNDIVALKSVNKQRTAGFRFYSQILSAPEQALYHQPPFADIPFENYVWLLWSVKESAYKYIKRILPDLVFSPTKIVIQYITIPSDPLMTVFKNTHWENTSDKEEFYSGMLIYDSYVFYFRSKISADWIATVVNGDEDFDNVCWGVQSIDDKSYCHQSKAARTLLLKRLNSFFPGDLQVKKSPVGYPVILRGTQNMHISASLAHDDRFVAYSFVLNQ
ncbi:MAG: 4'-phosphopantetheinyl transferase family protein [Bacteroidia bacterium]